MQGFKRCLACRQASSLQHHVNRQLSRIESIAENRREQEKEKQAIRAKGKFAEFSDEELEAEISRRRIARRVAATDALQRFMGFATDHLGIPYRVMISRQRPSHIANPRIAAMSAAYNLGLGGLVAVGKAFERDHGTVIHANKACEQRENTNKLRAELMKAWQQEETKRLAWIAQQMEDAKQ